MNLLQRTFCAISLIFLTAASLAGCGKTESENVESRGVYAIIGVFARGDGNTKVEARLQVGDGGLFRTDLKLSPGDRLVVYANGIARVMTKRNNVFDVIFGDLFDSILGTVYTASFPFDDDGLLIQVALERSSKVSAPDSRVNLPDAFTITTADDLVYADTDSVSLSWQPFNSADQMSIEYRFECVDEKFYRLTRSYTLSILDSGQQATPVSEILTQGGKSAMVDFTHGCDLSITLERKRNGMLDSNYGGGGRIQAHQRRMIEAGIAAPP